MTGPPLLVVVESEELAEPLRTWLTEETSISAGKRVGSTQVAVLPAQDMGQEARRQALLQGVRWLAENSAPQPHLRVCSLIPHPSLYMHAPHACACLLAFLEPCVNL